MAEMIQQRNSKSREMEVDLNNGAVSPKGEQTTQGHYSEEGKDKTKPSRGTAFTTIH